MKNTYESTKSFYKFINYYINLKGKKIIDFACGNGANLFYLSKKYPVSDCVGLDFNSSLLKEANNHLENKKIKNISFHIKDIENISKKNLNLKKKFDGITCIQTLSILDDYEKVIKSAIKLKPSFICVNSLFWNGDIDFKISVNFLKKNTKNRKIEKINQYNIYSINKYINFLKKNGYKKNIFEKLVIKKKIFNPNKKTMGTYTAKLDSKKVLVSGPLILDWYFILSSKS